MHREHPQISDASADFSGFSCGIIGDRDLLQSGRQLYLAGSEGLDGTTREHDKWSYNAPSKRGLAQKTLGDLHGNAKNVPAKHKTLPAPALALEASATGCAV